MIYDFKKLADKQKDLDLVIKEKAKDMKDMQYWDDRIMALMVEVGELANEIRFFKYWSNKPASPKEVILDELADCFHFAFSLGNTIENDSWMITMTDMKRPITYVFFDLMGNLTKMSHDDSKMKFRKVFKNLVEIAWTMGYTPEEIESAYNKKNAINYERVTKGY